MAVSEENKKYQLSTEVEESEKYRVTEDIERQIEKSSSLIQKVYDLADSFKGKLVNDNRDIKVLLALNILTGRENTQHLNMSLEGFESLVNNFSNPQILVNNNYDLEGRIHLTETPIYVFIEPPKSISGSSKDESYIQKIKSATEFYRITNKEYNLYVYINSDSYDEHKIIEDDILLSIEEKVNILTHVPLRHDLISSADVVVDEKPLTTLTGITDSFLKTFGLFRNRRDKVYFNYQEDDRYDVDREGLGYVDFLLLAYQSLPNLIVDPIQAEHMARTATEYWISPKENIYKFVYEEINDFYNCPSLVRIKGLSPFWGYITEREVKIRGVIINPIKEEEQELGDNFVLQSLGSVAPLLQKDEEDLRTYLSWNPRNLRHRLLKITTADEKTYVIRVEELIKKVKVLGNNEALDSGEADEYEVTDFKNMVFLTPYFLGEQYHETIEALKMYESRPIYPYRLPPEFTSYLKRKAARRNISNLPMDDIDLKWFKQSSSRLSLLVENVSEICDVGRLTRRGISPLEGITRREIILGWDDLLWAIKEK